MRRGVAKEFWGKRPHHAQAGYEEVYVEVMKLLPKNKGIRFLDLGCGIGNLEKFLWEEGYTNILAVNHSEKLLEIARKNLPQYKYQIMDVSRPFCFDDNSFDVVACLEVLQHNKNPFEVLSEAIRVGKKVILSIPNGFWSELRTFNRKKIFGVPNFIHPTEVILRNAIHYLGGEVEVWNYHYGKWGAVRKIHPRFLSSRFIILIKKK